MSSRILLQSLSGNLVRVSGPGYRENIRLREADAEARNEGASISTGASGAVIMLSRLSDLGFGKSRLSTSGTEQH